jgi:signal transduction histidine kinase
MENKNNLCINSTLADLDLNDISIETNKTVSDALKLLRKNQMVPGIIILSHGFFKGMISRTKLFDCMSRPFSNELYLNRSIGFLLDNNPINKALEFASDTLIADATLASLQRPADLLFEPVVVLFFDGSSKILDIHQLLLAQSQIHMLLVESLRKANEFKSEMLSIAAHDLKNPLNSIMGISSIIIEESAALPFVNKMATTVYKSSQQMLDLILRLLDSSIAELGKLELKKSQLDVYHLTAAVIANNAKCAEEKNQKLIFSSEVNEGVLILADKTLLTDAVDNIVSNAVKYSPPKSDIYISLETDNNIRISVQDEGPGIREEEKEKLFGKFQRLSSRPTGGESSTGLGLYIVKQIIELHGGSVYVESEFGHGSKFIIELPNEKD